MKKLFFLLFLLMCGSVSRAQTAEPTLDETVAWIKKTLLAYELEYYAGNL